MFFTVIAVLNHRCLSFSQFVQLCVFDECDLPFLHSAVKHGEFRFDIPTIALSMIQHCYGILLRQY